MSVIFKIILLCIFEFILTQKGKSYSKLKAEEYHPDRIRRFYKKAVGNLSQNRLFASLSHYGIGAFCSKDFKVNDVVMEIPGNFTISSFDYFFPYLEELQELIFKHAEKNTTNMRDINEVRLILNLNWVRYTEKQNRFFRIFFDNLPSYRESLLFWNNQEKEILKKFTGDHLIEKDLLFHNTTLRDYFIEDFKKILKKKDSHVAEELLSDKRVEEALDIIYSRSTAISLKGWKLIQNDTSDINEEDLENVGLIIIPGADAINHEFLIKEHPDVTTGQIKYELGKVVVKAGRNFKKGEEFTINYDVYESVYDMFRRYGFVPIEAIHKNMAFRYEYIDMANAPVAGKLVCLALGACIGDRDDNVFKVAKFTNRYNLAHLVIERLNNWFGPPFTEEKMFEIYNSIVQHRHSNLTEGIALSKFTHSFYGLLLYSTNFRTDISTLISMYNENEKGVSVRKNLDDHFFYKLAIDKQGVETNQRFAEIIKFSLLNHHIIALNTKQSIINLNHTLDNLYEELKSEILEETS